MFVAIRGESGQETYEVRHVYYALRHLREGKIESGLERATILTNQNALRFSSINLYLKTSEL